MRMAVDIYMRLNGQCYWRENVEVCEDPLVCIGMKSRDFVDQEAIAFSKMNGHEKWSLRHRDEIRARRLTADTKRHESYEVYLARKMAKLEKKLEGERKLQAVKHLKQQAIQNERRAKAALKRNLLLERRERAVLKHNLRVYEVFVRAYFPELLYEHWGLTTA